MKCYHKQGSSEDIRNYTYENIIERNTMVY